MKAVFLLPLVLAACSPCEPVFKDGEIVRHKFTVARYIVLRSASYKNMEGMCLVTVRAEDTGLRNLAAAELEMLTE